MSLLISEKTDYHLGNPITMSITTGTNDVADPASRKSPPSPMASITLEGGADSGTVTVPFRPYVPPTDKEHLYVACQRCTVAALTRAEKAKADFLNLATTMELLEGSRDSLLWGQKDPRRMKNLRFSASLLSGWKRALEKIDPSNTMPREFLEDHISLLRPVSKASSDPKKIQEVIDAISAEIDTFYKEEKHLLLDSNWEQYVSAHKEWKRCQKEEIRVLHAQQRASSPLSHPQDPSVTATVSSPPLAGETVFTFHPKRIIAELSSDPELEELFCLDAGVGEGYSIKEHTQMVLDVFDQEFASLPEVKALFESLGIDIRAFIVFLALHDIGKGRAVQEAKRDDPKDLRKERELKYTRELIEKHARVFPCSAPVIQLFCALLSEDCLGDYFKEKSPSVMTLAKLRKAFPSSLQDDQFPAFVQLALLFYVTDSSSYLDLRKLLFPTDPDRTILIGNVTVPCLRTDLLFLNTADPWTDNSYVRVKKIQRLWTRLTDRSETVVNMHNYCERAAISIPKILSDMDNLHKETQDRIVVCTGPGGKGSTLKALRMRQSEIQKGAEKLAMSYPYDKISNFPARSDLLAYLENYLLLERPKTQEKWNSMQPDLAWLDKTFALGVKAYYLALISFYNVTPTDFFDALSDCLKEMLEEPTEEIKALLAPLLQTYTNGSLTNPRTTTPEEREERRALTGRLFYHVYKIAYDKGMRTDDPSWGEHHAFDNIPNLIQAIQNTKRENLNQRLPEQSEAVSQFLLSGKNLMWLTGNQSPALIGIRQVAESELGCGPALVPTGTLLQHNIVPLTGELCLGIQNGTNEGYGGVSVNTVNLSGVTAEEHLVAYHYATSNTEPFSKEGSFMSLQNCSKDYPANIYVAKTHLLRLLQYGNLTERERSRLERIVRTIACSHTNQATQIHVDELFSLLRDVPPITLTEEEQSLCTDVCPIVWGSTSVKEKDLGSFPACDLTDQHSFQERPFQGKMLLGQDIQMAFTNKKDVERIQKIVGHLVVTVMSFEEQQTILRGQISEHTLQNRGPIRHFMW